MYNVFVFFCVPMYLCEALYRLWQHISLKRTINSLSIYFTTDAQYFENAQQIQRMTTEVFPEDSAEHGLDPLVAMVCDS